MIVEEAVFEGEAYMGLKTFRAGLREDEFSDFENYREESSCQYGRKDKGIPNRPVQVSHFSFPRVSTDKDPKVLLAIHDFHEEGGAKLSFITPSKELYDKAVRRVQELSGVEKLSTESAVETICVVA
tara:strand:- start:8595 stop:8975 length:381 start_codon:yes stop_codon:yes gene_type:complete